MSLAEQSLPQILLRSKSWSMRVSHEMKHHHRWFGVVFHFSKRFPRTLRIVSLATNIIIMLFIQAITYDMTHGSEESCTIYNDEVSCLEPRSAYNHDKSMCYWQPASESCHFVQPDNDTMIMAYIAIFSAIVSTPVAIAADWLVQNVLAAPLLNSSSLSSDSHGNRINNSPTKSAKIQPVVNPSDQLLDNTTDIVVGGNTRADAVHIDHVIQARTECQRLTTELQRYRLTLADTREFDGK